MKNLLQSWESPKTALVTGASSGIGAEFALQLARIGFDLIITARRSEKLEVLAAEIKKECAIEIEIILADISQPEGTAKIISTIESYSHIDVLVNNAGFSTGGDFKDISLQPQLDMMYIHMTAPVVLTRALLPKMADRGRGAVIFVSSGGAFYPSAGGAMYNSTKAFLVRFAESISIEMVGSGVVVQALCPGYTHTEFHNTKELKAYKDSVPRIFWSTAKEVVLESLDKISKGKTVLLSGRLNRFLKMLIPRNFIIKGMIKSKLKQNMKKL
jgi:uncharacterized protein